MALTQAPFGPGSGPVSWSDLYRTPRQKPAGSARPMYGLAPGVNRGVRRKALAAFMYKALMKVVDRPQASIG